VVVVVVFSSYNSLEQGSPYKFFSLFSVGAVSTYEIYLREVTNTWSTNGGRNRYGVGVFSFQPLRKGAELKSKDWTDVLTTRFDKSDF